ncbi:hypothetical protein CYMTET_33613 [Cymbomonas tetramitiformis]|uniref:Tetratricopeptide repeat protein n=1 Tax=Cymbomonas tetramitiformis TaxID=36881 RepID=A0AAE0FCU3_9CHLO|nr:hypothetical protein CYMTET_33613 [Cymbomonas tetramitiformis]
MSKTALSKKSGAANSSDIPDLLKNANESMKDEEWRESLLYFEKVLSLAKGKSSEPYQMKAIEGMAQINFKLNSYNEASRLFQECLDLCYIHHDKSLERRCYSGLGICYVQMAMPKEAAEQLQYATTLQEKEGANTIWPIAELWGKLAQGFGWAAVGTFTNDSGSVFGCLGSAEHKDKGDSLRFERTAWALSAGPKSRVWKEKP